MTEGIDQKYSDPEPSGPGPGRGAERLYAVDSGSPLSSVTLRWRGEFLTRSFQVGDSSGRLITDLDELLAQVGGCVRDLEGLVALAGPGSFTGLRVGLATILGLHQATGIPATAITTFEALAWQARRRDGASTQPIVAAVNALRGERFVQTFDGTTLAPTAESVIRPDAEVAGLSGTRVIGFGLQALRESSTDTDSTPDTARAEVPQADLLEAEALAPDLAAIASQPGFAHHPDSLTKPLYLRPAAVTPAKPKR